MSKLKIAIQKSGRLSEKSLNLLKESGINISNGTSKLRAEAKNFPIEVLFLRDDDIPQYVEQQVADIGILGKNEVLEKGKNVTIIEELGFAACRLSLAIPKGESYSGLKYFNNKSVATSYPNILSQFFANNNITAELEEIGGSVEIAPSIGLANAVCDIVSTGSTLITNGLKEVETVLKSQAVLIANKELSKEKRDILDKLLFRIKAVIRSSENKYIVLNAPNEAIDKISGILPGMKSPTVVPLAKQGWSSMHSVVKEDEFWDVIDQLRTLGAEGILVIPIEKMVL
ncbi:MAG: ATP phosphoribosyltransferase [Flavobacteriales bacterium]|nr:ATP phosphoribosyltransferase [Flavobacteriales bacterium]